MIYFLRKPVYLAFFSFHSWLLSGEMSDIISHDWVTKIGSIFKDGIVEETFSKNLSSMVDYPEKHDGCLHVKIIQSLY